MNRHIQLPLAVLLGLFAALPCSAEIYKSVGPDGKVIYTDVPGGTKIKEVDLPTINAAPSKTPRIRTYQKTVKLDAPIPNYTPAITSPANNTDIMPDQRDLNVSSAAGAKLREGDQFQLMINGRAFGKPSKDSNFTVKEIFRGQHSVSVAVIDKDGQVLKASDPVTVNVIRPVVKRR